MRYCPDCGTGHECEGGQPSGQRPEVEIARINADRDVAVAKLQARMEREALAVVEEVAELEAETELVTSAAEAEVVAAAIENSGVAEPEPIIVDAPPPVEEEPDADQLPPAEGSAPPEPKHKASGIGFW